MILANLSRLIGFNPRLWPKPKATADEPVATPDLHCFNPRLWPKPTATSRFRLFSSVDEFQSAPLAEAKGDVGLDGVPIRHPGFNPRLWPKPKATSSILSHPLADVFQSAPLAEAKGDSGPHNSLGRTGFLVVGREHAQRRTSVLIFSRFKGRMITLKSDEITRFRETAASGSALVVRGRTVIRSAVH